MEKWLGAVEKYWNFGEKQSWNPVFALIVVDNFFKFV
jgi:hypothetical protein